MSLVINQDMTSIGIISVCKRTVECGFCPHEIESKSPQVTCTKTGTAYHAACYVAMIAFMPAMKRRHIVN